MLRIKNLLKSIFSLSLFMIVFLQMKVDAESLNYSVMKDDKPIGRIHIDRTKTNDITEYFFESNVVSIILFVY